MKKKLLTAMSVSLPFRTAVSIGLTVDEVTFVRSTMKPRLEITIFYPYLEELCYLVNLLCHLEANLCHLELNYAIRS